jgi:hypothetical protein
MLATPNMTKQERQLLLPKNPATPPRAPAPGYARLVHDVGHPDRRQLADAKQPRKCHITLVG